MSLSLRCFFLFSFFFLLFGSKAGFSAGACLWGFAESLPSNGEHLLPCFLLSGLAAEIREPVKGVEGGVGGWGISWLEQAVVLK